MIERRETTRLVCPPDLNRALPEAPPMAEGGIIRHNDAGGAFLDRKIARGEAAEAVIDDAKAACALAGAR